MLPKLQRINKLTELQEFERFDSTCLMTLKTRFTKDVQLLLVTRDDKIIISNKWAYLAHNDELVYHKKKNLWITGRDFYEQDKSHIKDIFVVNPVNTKRPAATSDAPFD